MRSNRLHEGERNCYALRSRPLIGYQSPLFASEPTPVLAVQPRHALTGQGRRDRGIHRVSSRSPFLRDALHVAAGLLRVGATVTGEDVRMMLEARGLHPHNPNAWGALTSRLVRSGVLRETGRFLAGKRPAAHARRNAEYVVATVEPLGSGTSTSYQPETRHVVARVESLSHPGEFYQITERDGELCCSCAAASYGRPCRHLAEAEAVRS